VEKGDIRTAMVDCVPVSYLLTGLLSMYLCI